MGCTASVIWDEGYLAYDFGDHPMNPARLEYTMELARALGVLDNVELLAPTAATEAELLSVHDDAYLRAVHAASTDPAFQGYGLGTDDDPVFGRIMTRAAACFSAPLEFVQSVNALSDEYLEDFDVAVIDYDLGSVTGLELTRYVDERRPMPIVLVSGKVRVPERRWSDSIHDFVHKDNGPHAIMDAAFEAHEIACIHKSMRHRSTAAVSTN